MVEARYMETSCVLCNLCYDILLCIKKLYNVVRRSTMYLWHVTRQICQSWNGELNLRDVGLGTSQCISVWKLFCLKALPKTNNSGSTTDILTMFLSAPRILCLSLDESFSRKLSTKFSTAYKKTAHIYFQSREPVQIFLYIYQLWRKTRVSSLCTYSIRFKTELLISLLLQLYNASSL